MSRDLAQQQNPRRSSSGSSPGWIEVRIPEGGKPLVLLFIGFDPFCRLRSWLEDHLLSCDLVPAQLHEGFLHGSVESIDRRQQVRVPYEQVRVNRRRYLRQTYSTRKVDLDHGESMRMSTGGNHRNLVILDPDVGGESQAWPRFTELAI